MNLQELIKSINTTAAPLNGAPATKTASASADGADKSALDAAMGAALQALSTPKTAAEKETATPAATPVSDLKKIAEEQVEHNKQAELQHAYLTGMAMADGFVQGLNQYKEAAEKVAETQTLNTLPDGITAEDVELIKMAKEDPASFLQLVQQGYGDQIETVKQSSEQVYEEVYNQTVQGIHKVATEHYLAGYSAAQSVIQELAQGA